MLRGLQEVESVLGESEQERKDIRDKYIALGEKVELLLHQEEHVKSSADRDTEAARMAVKEAVSDLELVCLTLSCAFHMQTHVAQLAVLLLCCQKRCFA